MGAIDGTTGIYVYDETDDASPVSDLLNLLGSSVMDRVGADVTKVETFEDVTTPAGTSYTASTLLATATAITSATYDRVVEVSATINESGVTAAKVWAGVITSDGAVVTSNVIDSARFPFASSAAIGGSVKLHATFSLAAGSTALPRLWVQEIIDGGSVTVTDSRFTVRVRPKVAT